MNKSFFGFFVCFLVALVDLVSARPLKIFSGSGFTYFYDIDPSSLGQKSDLFLRAVPRGILILEEFDEVATRKFIEEERKLKNEQQLQEQKLDQPDSESLPKDGDGAENEEPENSEVPSVSEVVKSLKWMHQQSERLADMVHSATEKPEDIIESYQELRPQIAAQLQSKLWRSSAYSNAEVITNQFTAGLKNESCLSLASERLQRLLLIEDVYFDFQTGDYIMDARKARIYSFPEKTLAIETIYQTARDNYLHLFDDKAGLPCLNQIGTNIFVGDLDFPNSHFYRRGYMPQSDPFVLLILNTLKQKDGDIKFIDHYLRLVNLAFDSKQDVAVRRVGYFIWSKINQNHSNIGLLTSDETPASGFFSEQDWEIFKRRWAHSQ